MKALCPKNSQHQKFFTTAVVEQEWIVDSEGNFIDEQAPCLDVLYDPTHANPWTCAECGAVAQVTPDPDDPLGWPASLYCAPIQTVLQFSQEAATLATEVMKTSQKN